MFEFSLPASENYFIRRWSFFIRRFAQSCSVHFYFSDFAFRVYLSAGFNFSFSAPHYYIHLHEM